MDEDDCMCAEMTPPTVSPLPAYDSRCGYAVAAYAGTDLKRTLLPGSWRGNVRRAHVCMCPRAAADARYGLRVSASACAMRCPVLSFGVFSGDEDYEGAPQVLPDSPVACVAY